MTTATSERTQIHVVDADRITLSHKALSEMLIEQYKIAQIETIRDICELLDEVLMDDEGDALATIAPMLHHFGIEERDVAS